jgi:hypothetical protein
VAYDYDPYGNRTRVTHPDGAFFEYAHDAADSLMCEQALKFDQDRGRAGVKN